ncbi:MAG: DegV family protein [Bacilli bacterium]|jgi:DegV family protein with EDD domain|nr:DegV family protein [Bacilli bacterium]
MAKKYKFKIVVDSSSNLTKDYIKDEEVGFAIAPLTIRVDGKDYVDDGTIDPKDLLQAVHSYEGKSTTSCPSPAVYEEAYEDAENVIVVTISSKMSGSFNAAYVASIASEDTRVHVVDSKGTAGSLVLIVDKAYELIKAGKSMDEIEEEIEAYNNSRHLLFVLNSFENLIKAGRMNKVVAFVATTIGIKPICEAYEGEIKTAKKARTIKKAFITLKDMIAERVTDYSQRQCIIAYCEGDEESANFMKKLIEEAYNFKVVRTMPNTLLCSYYALEGSLTVAF